MSQYAQVTGQTVAPESITETAFRELDQALADLAAAIPKLEGNLTTVLHTIVPAGETPKTAYTSSDVPLVSAVQNATRNARASVEHIHSIIDRVAL